MNSIFFNLLLLTLLFPFLSLAQNEAESASEMAGKFKFGVHYSTDLAYRSLHSDVSFPFSNVVASRNDSEVPKLGFSAGVSLEYALSKCISLALGLSYLNQGYKTKWLPITSTTNPNPISPGRGKSTFTYYFLNIPLSVNASIGKKKVKFFSSTGISFDFLLQDKIKTTLERGQGTETFESTNNFDYNLFNLSGIISLGAEFTCHSQHVVRVAPIFRYNFLTIIDAPIKQRMFNAGLNVTYLFATKK